MKILLIGSTGRLGTALRKELKDYDLDTSEEDITDFRAVKERVKGYDTVISTAAYHDVDKCEQYPKKAFEVNGFATKNLAEACQQFMWVSTNYVFSEGDRKESDTPNPINVYGMSKALGEHYVRKNPNHYIIRTAGLFGPEKGNIIDTLSNLDKVKAKTDEYFTCTYTIDLAKAMHQVLLTGEYGTYHLYNQGKFTVYELAKLLRDDVEKCKREPGDIRPKDASLTTNKIFLPTLKDALKRYENT